MSKKRWGVFALALFILFVIILTVFLYQRNKTSTPQSQRGTQFVERIPENINSTQLSVNNQLTQIGILEEQKKETILENVINQPKETYKFILVNDNNYVTVYELPEYQIYEYTDVILDVLPVELQEEIKAGKYLKNEEELYNFLENYTS